MKRLSLFLCLLVFSLSVLAQDNTLKFLGIPVDGSKQSVISSLKAKGFTYDSYHERLEGRFNGMDVEVYVLDNNGRVHRIVVVDKYQTDEGQIITAFNHLLYQFQENGKYVALEGNEELSSKEDVSYEMAVNHKQYDAGFTLKGNPDGVVWFKIDREYGKYNLVIFYDNMANHSHGEDL